MSSLRLLSRRLVLVTTGSTALVLGGGYYYLTSGPTPAHPSTRATRRPPPPWTPPSRTGMLASLRASGRSDSTSEQDPSTVDDAFDILIVGGGATGAGIAVDAASRGLKVALVDRGDFACGTSSKSTKLVHGGVRYLQKAVFELDYEQYKLVREALRERRVFLQTAPYLSGMLPIMLPVYQYWQIPYYYAGCKLYDLLAGAQNIAPSYLLSRAAALEAFPTLRRDGLVGAVVYHDGQHNDARMNVALVLTAARLGATVANYVSLDALGPPPPPPPPPPADQGAESPLRTAMLTDRLTSQTFPVRFKCIVNATGASADTLLALDSASTSTQQKHTPAPLIAPSRGTHIVLPSYYAPPHMGLLDPSTSDGRVVFVLPWEGGVLAGTTDVPVPAPGPGPSAGVNGGLGLESTEILPTEPEIQWILSEVRRYLSPDVRVRRADVLSAWAGLRPLVRAPAPAPASSTSTTKEGTQALVRSHVVQLSAGGMITVAGGKWTTYREMARDAVDVAVRAFGLRARARPRGQGVEGGEGVGVEGEGEEGGTEGVCVTERLKLVGSEGWYAGMHVGLVQRYGLDADVARHLAESYGDRAWVVCEEMERREGGRGRGGERLSEGYPFIDAEVHYSITHEYALTPIDVLARRTRLAFLNARAALAALPRVVDIMAAELDWSLAERKQHIAAAVAFFASMGLPGAPAPEPVPRGAVESAWAWARRGFGFGAWALGTRGQKQVQVRLEQAELEALTAAFERYKKSEVVDGRVEEVIELARLGEAVLEVRGYEGVTRKDFVYVLEQAGLAQKAKGLDFDEFIEVCGNLKEVVFVPAVN